MRNRIGLMIVAAVSAVSLLAASSASGATEVGDNCPGTNALGSNFTAFQSGKGASNPLPLAAPAAGIVTSWKVGSKIPAELPQQLKVLRSTGTPKGFQTVAESSPGTVVQGQNTFLTRIPVQAGDRFAAAAGAGSVVLYCPSPDPLDVMGYNPTNVAVGSTNDYETAPGIRIALTVVIEPDADNDGFGDETQDKCPRSAALQAVECPIIGLSSYGIASKGSALLLVSASSASSVTVSASVNVPKGGKKGKKGTKTAIIPAGTKPVGDGQVVPFTIVFSQSVKAALAALPPGKSLTMTVTSTTTDLAGQLSSSQVTLKLKGQKKGKAKAKGKKA